MYAGFTEAAHHERLITQVGVRFNGYGVLQQSADHRSAGAAGGGEDRRCMSQAWDNEATFYKWEAKYGGMGCRTRNVARFRPAIRFEDYSRALLRQSREARSQARGSLLSTTWTSHPDESGRGG